MSKKGKICYLVFILSLVILFTARFMLGGWIDYLYLPLTFAVGSLVLATIFDWRVYVEFLSMKTTKHGMNMGVLILLALLLAVVVNFLGVRFDKSIDITKEKINSLADQSVSLLKSLKSDVQILIFYKGKDLRERAREIKSDFKLYEKQSPHIKVLLVDANRDVELAKKYLQSTDAFATLVEYKDRKVVIQPSGGSPDRPYYQEKDITSTIMKITRDVPMTVQFLTGHGEKDIDQSSIEGLKILADVLRNDGYDVAKLNLQLGNEKPMPGSVLAIIGPKTSLSDNELSIIREFAKSGGKLLVAADPGEKHQISLLTKSFGVEFKNNFILNETNLNEGLIGAVGLKFDSVSPITKKLTQSRSLVVFPFASEVARAPDAPTEYTYRDIIKSHERAYINSSANAVKNPERKEITMAITAKNDKFSGVFFGDSDFISDVRIANWAHLDIFMNSIAYLFNDEMNITIRPKNLEATTLNITPAKSYFLIIAGVGLPLILIALSGLFWYRRRNL